MNQKNVPRQEYSLGVGLYPCSIQRSVGALAQVSVAAGYDVALSNSRGPSSLQELVDGLGERAHAMTAEEAAQWGDIVVLMVPFRKPEAFPPSDAVAGKVVVDATNPYSEDFTVVDLGEDTSSEIVARRLPGARIVKAFNTIYFEHLRHGGNRGKPVDERRAILVAADDEEAKAIVSQFIEELGFAPVDTGGPREGGRLQQPPSPLYNRDITGIEARAQVTSMR